MRKVFASTAIAVAALVGSALPSSAVTVYNLGLFSPGGQHTAAMSTNTDGPGAFTDVLAFQLNTNATLESSIFANIGELIIPWAVQLYQGVYNAGAPQGAPVFAGVFAPQSITQSFGPLGQANVWTSWYLEIDGNLGPNTGGYGGNVHVDFPPPGPPPVPLPGALLLMGTVLAGGAGFAKFRKKDKRALASC